MSANIEKKTTDNNYMIIGVKRLDRLLSGIFEANLPATYRRIPRTNSFGAIKVQSSNNVESSMLVAESTDKEESKSKPIYSRQISRSTNFLSDAERNQKNIIYNWSGLHEIARESQIIRPNSVNQLVRLIQTAASKVIILEPKSDDDILCFCRYL